MTEERDNLRVKTARASLAMAGLNFAMRPISLVGSILLARWLLPEHFGAVGMAGIVIGLADMFVGFGLGMAIIQSPHDRSRIAFYGFSVTSLSGLVASLLVAAGADQLAALVGDVAVAPYIRWMSLLVFLHGLVLIPSSLLKKELRFGSIAQISVITQLIYLGVALSLAYFNFGIWSLIAGRIANLAATVLLTWYLCPGWDWLIPKPLDRGIIKELLTFGLHTTSGGTLGYIIGNWDDWLVGRYLGAASLGFYRRAYDFMDKNVISISGGVIGNVLLSTFSQLQQDKKRLTRIYLKANRLIWLVMVPLALGVIIVAPELVIVLLGQKWAPMIPTLQIFSLMILTRAFSFNTSSLFSAVGRPDIVSRGAFLLLAIMVPIALLLLRFGFNGVALAALISDFFGVLFFVYQVQKLLPGTGIKTFSQGLPMLLAGGAMVAGVHSAKPFVFDMTGGQYNLLSLVLLVAIGGLIYLALAFLLQRELIQELLRLAWEALNSRGLLNRFMPRHKEAT